MDSKFALRLVLISVAIVGVLVFVGLFVKAVYRLVSGPDETESAARVTLSDEKMAELTTRYQKVARKGWHIAASPVKDAALPAGASKLGGAPDLPPGTAWPEWKGKPLSFIGQVNLEDARQPPGDSLLPTTGLLVFFYDFDQESSGYDPADKGCARVLYFPAPTGQVKRATLPTKLPREARFKACKLTLAPDDTFPPSSSELLKPFGLNDAQKNEYDDFRAQRHPGPAHQLLGHADPIQNEMELECQLAANGVNAGDEKSAKDPRRKALEAGAKDWLLLLQVDSDDNPGWMWGDAGRIYYWIRKQDLEKRDFDKVWLILQCS